MNFFWNCDFLTRRIDRCYMIAAGARKPEKRKVHLELARYYRRMLASLTPTQHVRAAEWATASSLAEANQAR